MNSVTYSFQDDVERERERERVRRVRVRSKALLRQARSTLEPSRLHDAVVVKARSRLAVEVLVLRYVLGVLVEKSRIQNDVRHQFNHLLLLQLRCNYGTEINLHWSGPRTLLASTLSLHRLFSLSGFCISSSRLVGRNLFFKLSLTISSELN